MALAFYFIRRLWDLDRLGASWPMKFRLARWIVSFSFREFAFQWAAAACLLIALLVGLGASDGVVGAGLVAILGALLLADLWFAWQSWRSAAAVARELADFPPETEALRFPRLHLVFPFLMLFSRRVAVDRGVVFHRDGGRKVRLDVYRPTSPGEDLRPAVLQIHGGGWVLGSRLEQGIPLLTHLAANGWVGFNADYRLSPAVTMPEHVVDVKRAIAWIREHGAEYGADPDRIVITGGSAGGHLVALAALTANDRELQPGFEEIDTSVIAAVPFYGIYDLTDPDVVYWHDFRHWLLEKVVIGQPLEEARDLFIENSPTHRVHAGAPPFLIFHGDSDILIPVADARSFVAELERVSESTVRYVELPGADHAFDVFPSLRSAVVIEGIERFLRGLAADPAQFSRAGHEPDRDRLVSSA